MPPPFVGSFVGSSFYFPQVSYHLILILFPAWNSAFFLKSNYSVSVIIIGFRGREFYVILRVQRLFVWKGHVLGLRDHFSILYFHFPSICLFSLEKEEEEKKGII